MRIILPEGSLNDSQEPEAAHTFKEEKILTEGGLSLQVLRLPSPSETAAATKEALWRLYPFQMGQQ